MDNKELKFKARIINIGDSKGVVIPKPILYNLDQENEKYEFTIKKISCE